MLVKLTLGISLFLKNRADHLLKNLIIFLPKAQKFAY